MHVYVIHAYVRTRMYMGLLLASSFLFALDTFLFPAVNVLFFLPYVLFILLLVVFFKGERVH
jgi:hypothetical protein